MVRASPQLLVLKLYLFWSYGAFASLWPFLTVHMRSLGLNMEETTIINLVLPFTSLLGPPAACYLADKLGRRRLVLVLCLLMSGVLYSALLFVPSVERYNPRTPEATFTCGPRVGIIHLERCDHRCELPKANYEVQLQDCHTVCPKSPVITAPPIIPDEVDTTNLTELPLPSHQIQYKPKLCFDQGECHVYNASGMNESLTLYLNNLSPVHVTDEECQYRLNGFTRPGLREIFEGIHCQTGLSSNCHIKCKFIETSFPPIFQSPRCIRTEGDAVLTFWVYFGIRILAELFPPACLALMDAIILNMVQKYRGEYSKQVLFGIAAIGVFPPIVGILGDFTGSFSHKIEYTAAFITFDILLLVSSVMVTFLDKERTDYMPRMCKHVGKLLRNVEILVLFIVVFVLGTQFGFIETFFYWNLQDMGANQLLLGLTMTAGVVPSIPFLFFSDVIVRKFGKANLLILALFIYSVRFTGYAYIPGPYWALPFEALEVFTLNLMWVSTATYCAEVSPRMLLATTMGMAMVLHYNAGRGVGALASGYTMDRFGTQLAYQGSAVFTGCIGLIYFAVYHFYLKDKRTPVILEPTTNGHSPSWEQHTSNGDAQAYKPMLGSQNN